MAAASNATRAFFARGGGVALAVYDTRRGAQEGREADKVLAFYPPTAPAGMQASIVGLAQALTMFAGTFNKECPFHCMEAHKHVWAMYHAEPDLWLLLVVGRGLVGPNCQRSALTGLLKGLHGVAALLHGLLSTQLEQDPSGARVRLRLQPLLQEGRWQPAAARPRGPVGAQLPLGPHGGVPLLPVSPAALTRLQSVVNSLLVCRLFGTRPVCGVLVAWQTCLLWSSLSSGDTAALHSLAVRGLQPAAREGPRHKPRRRPIVVGAGHQQHASPQPSPQPSPQSVGSEPQLPQSTRPSSTTGVRDSGPGHVAAATSSNGSSSLQADCVCLASASSWHCRHDGMLLPAWLGDTDGSDSVVGAGCSQLPLVWLQSGSEAARLMAWHSGPLLFLVLLEPSGPAASSCAAVTASLSEVVSGPAAALAASLAAELPAKHLWHVKGLRYLYQDHLAAAVRASPLRKVATLAPASLRLAAEARQWTALEATAAADPTAAALGAAAAAAAAGSAGRPGAAASAGAHHDSDGGACASGSTRAAAEAWEAFAAGSEEADVEVVVRGANDAWVVGRTTAAGRQLTAVVEADKEGLPGVMRRVDAFCDAQCPGVFDGLA